MKRHKHSLSHYRLLTCDMGQLVPVGCVEVLPGDTFQQRSSALIRVSPLLAPVMHPVQVRLHHFFVPNRILWDGWEDFITGGPDGMGSDDPLPQITVPANAQGSILDYLGIPPVENVEINALPIRAYNLIFNEFYRDQDLVPEVNEDSTALQRCAWEKDYFASARPFSQKGPSITVPLGDRAPVLGLGKMDQNFTNQGEEVYETGGTGPVIYESSMRGNSGSPNNSQQWEMLEDPDNPGFPGVYADLSESVGADVIEFRRAFALQRYQEARARYGSRYTEYLAYLGIKARDARLQRPEYLGGGRQTIQFSEVLRTGNEGPGGDPIGELKGHGIAAMRSRRYRKFFEEHGFVISLMSVRPKAMYSQNVHRKWLRQTKEDYFQKELEAIGQQEVLNNEIYADDGPAGLETFGYADRYREYREEPSTVSGEFRELLNYWHLARDFGSAPVLNQDFITCNPTKRIYAEQTQNSLWCMVNHSIQARRMVNRSAHSSLA